MFRFFEFVFVFNFRDEGPMHYQMSRYVTNAVLFHIPNFIARMKTNARHLSEDIAELAVFHFSV